GHRDEPSLVVGPGVSRRARRASGDSVRRAARSGAATHSTDAGAGRKVTRTERPLAWPDRARHRREDSGNDRTRDRLRDSGHPHRPPRRLVRQIAATYTRTGNDRTLFPVNANTAFAIAGATGG